MIEVIIPTHLVDELIPALSGEATTWLADHGITPPSSISWSSDGYVAMFNDDADAAFCAMQWREEW